MIIQTIKFQSRLPEEEVLRIAREREPQFQKISGLIQKYYIKLPQENHYGGIYVWDSRESLNAFRNSELAAGIPKAYGIVETPSIEVVEVLFQLKD